MGQFQKRWVIVLLSFVFSWGAAAADFGLGIGTGGFQGAGSFSLAVDWRQTHTIEFGVGQYVLDNGHGVQLNLGYRYLPFTVRAKGLTWSPISFGLLALYALDRDDYFTESPSKYPSEGYYEETGIRTGVEVATQLAGYHDHVRVLYKVILMDTGVLALWNNDGRYAQYFLSSGLSLQYYF